MSNSFTVGVWSPLFAETDGGGNIFEAELIKAITHSGKSKKWDFDLTYIPPGVAPDLPNNSVEPELVFFPSAFGVEIDIPYIATVWDLQHRRQPYFPEVSSGGEWYAREARHTRYLQRASAVIVPNLVGKQEVCQYYGLEPDNVFCITHPVPGDAIAAELEFRETPPPRPDWLPEGGFLFYPAQFWPHKNHYVIIKACEILKKRGIDLNLVFTGSDKGNLDFVRNQCCEAGLDERVFFPGFVTRRELMGLYYHAEALVYPSLFGPENLPPLEAQALKCPVILSDYPGALEQLGNTVVLCDRYSPDAWAHQIESVLKTPYFDKIDMAYESVSDRTADRFLDGVFEILNRLEKSRRLWGVTERNEIYYEGSESKLSRLEALLEVTTNKLSHLEGEMSLLAVEMKEFKDRSLKARLKRLIKKLLQH